MQKTARLYSKIGQLVIVVLLGFSMLLNFYMMNMIQGTGRVINYAGIVRGATQRLIKLELAGLPNDELISYLDEILRGLEYGGEQYNLDRLPSEDYLGKLLSLARLWEELKVSIKEYRLDAGGKDLLVSLSEVYYDTADDMVGAAEEYSESKVQKLRVYEAILFMGIGALIIISLLQTLYEIKITRKNKELSVAAYLDRLTGLPGRRSCEELICYPVDPEGGPYCVIMFDLNNLKQVNDTLGHQIGDRLIKAFADILSKFNSEKVFAGRYGGDEFLMIIHDYQEQMVVNLLSEIHKEAEDFNNKGSKFKILYACGYEYGGDNLQRMVEKADEKMYENKRRMKGI